MKNTALLFVTFVVITFETASSAYIPLKAENEDIKSNLIERDSNQIKSLQPPKTKAEDLYYPKSLEVPSEVEYPYMVEISRFNIKFQTSDFPPQIIQLTPKETEGIQKLSLAFVELLTNSKLSYGADEEGAETPVTWKELNPFITLTNSGLTVRFENKSNKEENSFETTDSEKIIVWDFLTKYAKNVFNKKIKEFNLNENDATILDSEKDHSNTNQTSSFKMFVDAIWKIMRFSIKYAESNFGKWIQPESETTTDKMKDESKGKKKIFTFFEYEESAPYHQFPAMELEKRIRDTGSIFYGRGII